jgi:hypothetical protein
MAVQSRAAQEHRALHRGRHVVPVTSVY